MSDSMIGKVCVIRTYSAGVHVGTVQRFDGREVELTDARRVWRWRGANSLHELALRGCDDSYSRISEPVPSIVLTEAIEVIPCSANAAQNLSLSRWDK